MSVLVTGASGFIGSHLARRLLTAGEDVHVLLREGSSAARLEGLGDIERWTGQVEDTGSLEECLKGARPERIFHCAGTSRARNSSGPDVIREALSVNVDGLTNLLEAIGRAGAPVRCLVRLGGLEEYGSGPAPFVETQREAPRSAYSASQVAGTHLLQALQPTLSFAAVTIRPTLIYGPAQSTGFMIPSLIEALLAGRPFALGEGRQTRDLLHVDDLVTAMIAASTAQGVAGEIINVATGVAPTVRSIAETIGRMLGRPDLLQFGKLADRPNDIIDLRGDASKAERLLGWRPTISLEDGLARTIEWHRSKNREGCAA